MTQTNKKLLEIAEQLTEEDQRHLLWQAIQMIEPEEPEPGDIEAIKQARAEYERGEFIRLEDVM